jgi:hypothetical protein
MNTPTKTEAANDSKLLTDSVLIKRNCAGGISIIPTYHGCIVLPHVGVSVYRNTHVNEAVLGIKKICRLSAELEYKIHNHPLIKSLNSFGAVSNF